MVKNVSKTVLLVFIAWMVLPTGDPSDFIITVALINMLGFKLYAMLSAVLLFILYKEIEGKTIPDKIGTVKKEMRAIFK